MPKITLLPACPLCDNAIEVYEASTVYVEDGYKALAHEDCVVGEGSDEFDGEDDEFDMLDFDPEHDEEAEDD